MTTLQKTYPTIVQSFITAGIVIAANLLFTPIALLLDELISKEATKLVYYLLSMGVALLIVCRLSKRKDKLTALHTRVENLWMLPLIMVATIALVFGIIFPLSELIPVPESIQASLAGSVVEKGIFTLLLMGLAAPILEEVLFRGIILNGLLKNYTPWKSIFLSSFLFGAVHMNPWQLLAGCILGIFLGWIYYESRNILLSILIHATANVCGYVVRFIDGNGALIQLYGGVGSLLLIIGASLMLLMGSIYILRKEFGKEHFQATIHPV